MKLIVIKQSKGCKFMPKSTKIRFGGQAGLLPRPDPLRELMRSSRPRRRNEGPTSMGRERREGEDDYL